MAGVVINYQRMDNGTSIKQVHLSAIKSISVEIDGKHKYSFEIEKKKKGK